jgi:hypothetical protein
MIFCLHHDASISDFACVSVYADCWPSLDVAIFAPGASFTACADTCLHVPKFYCNYMRNAKENTYMRNVNDNTHMMNAKENTDMRIAKENTHMINAKEKCAALPARMHRLIVFLFLVIVVYVQAMITA